MDTLFGRIRTGKIRRIVSNREMEETVTRKGLKTILAISAVCLGLAVLPANASENRSIGFSIPCDSQTHTQFFVATGLGTASTRFIQGAEMAVTINPGALQFLTISVSGSNAADLVVLGAGNSHAARDFTGFYSVPNTQGSSGGTVTFQIQGACNAGSGPTVDGIAVIAFFS